MRSGDRTKFVGIFERYGTKTNFKGYLKKPSFSRTLSNVQSALQTIYGLGELKEGDVVEFHARVKEYYKGYKGYKEEIQWEKPIEQDYKLSHPTKIRRYNANTQVQTLSK